MSGAVLQRPADLPVVPVRVADTAQAPAIWLIRYRIDQLGPCRDGLRYLRVRIVNNECQSHRGTVVERLRAEVGIFGRLVRDEKAAAANFELRDNVAVRAFDAVDFLCAERAFVKLDRRGSAP